MGSSESICWRVFISSLLWPKLIGVFKFGNFEVAVGAGAVCPSNCAMPADPLAGEAGVPDEGAATVGVGDEKK